ncbi:helix-turn-helix domain-containing protein [Streptacidiphilus anmyonensis]|uniref:helix-turn-helix domain-containing protein n=1 Tax=Streptacidiphilus anmyonensis TaxID=405782 RepID=UPI000694FA6E|nr:helix-turn-helix domain-containing protein [Streptacidiphilus anmyonensis]
MHHDFEQAHQNRDDTLIALLAAGHTDASAARRLGVSRRTVTNMIRSMMDGLGINNRFQLGIAVGARSRSCARCPAPRHPVRPVDVREPALHES